VVMITSVTVWEDLQVCFRPATPTTRHIRVTCTPLRSGDTNTTPCHTDTSLSRLTHAPSRPMYTPYIPYMHPQARLESDYGFEVSLKYEDRYVHPL
jgi:hypothetical protein